MTGHIFTGYQKIYGKFYLVTCTDISYTPDLSVSIFSVTRALTKGLTVMTEKERHILKKNATILKFE